MRTPKRRQDRTTQPDLRRGGHRPSPEARARYADAQAQAALRRMFPGF